MRLPRGFIILCCDQQEHPPPSYLMYNSAVFLLHAAAMRLFLFSFTTNNHAGPAVQPPLPQTLCLLEFRDSDLSYVCTTYPRTGGETLRRPETLHLALFDVISVLHPRTLSICGRTGFLWQRLVTLLQLHTELVRFQPRFPRSSTICYETRNYFRGHLHFPLTCISGDHIKTKL